MKNKITILFLFCFTLSITSFAQKEKLTREDKDEKNQARTARINNKNDYALLRRQMQALKEFADEKKKIPNLLKNNKGPVKVVAVIDSNDNDNEASEKRLIGYIRQDVGDNTTNMYEITYDRTQKKIITIKRTPEGMDADKEEADENVSQKKTKVKTRTTTKKNKDADDDEEVTEKKTKVKTTHKKSKDEDEDDDPDEEKPSKTKHKESDDD